MAQRDRIGMKRDNSLILLQLCDSEQNVRDWNSSKAGSGSAKGSSVFLPPLKNPFFQPLISPGLSTKNQPYGDESVMSRFTYSLLFTMKLGRQAHTHKSQDSLLRAP